MLCKSRRFITMLNNLKTIAKEKGRNECRIAKIESMAKKTTNIINISIIIKYTKIHI